MKWPFKKDPKKIARNKEIERLTSEVSAERTKYYGNLVKLDDASRSLDKEGVRGMLIDMFRHIDEAKRRD